MNRAIVVAVLFVFAFTGCAKKQPAADSNQPQATVLLRDGTTMAGAVVESTPSEIKLLGSDGVTRAVAMNKVKSIDYGETAAAQQPESAPPPQATAPPPSSEAAPPPEPEPKHEPHYRPTEAQVTTKTYVVPAGTQVPVRVEETIDSGKGVEGQEYAAEVTRDIHDQAGAVVIPRGANAEVVIKSATKGNRFHGTSDLVLDLKAVSVAGRMYRVEAADVSQKGKEGFGANKRTAVHTGGGAALGAIIGAIAGGGKGAAIGAGAGAGAGAITQMVTKGGAIKVPAETVLTFRLDAPLHVVEAR
jgi:outer membrane lipoprotein SlyB